MGSVRWSREEYEAHQADTNKRLSLAVEAMPIAAPRFAVAQLPVLLVKPAPNFDVFHALLLAAGVPAPVREFKFHPVRKWRLDFAWPEVKVAVEVEGGLWSRSEAARAAHSKPLAILRDMSKSNALALAGWRLLRYTPDQLEAAVPEIAQLLGGSSWNAPSLVTPPRSRRGSGRAAGPIGSRPRPSGG